MDAVAAAALAAIVDHDCARVLQDMIAENAALRRRPFRAIAENAALHQRLEGLRARLGGLRAKLRKQADITAKQRQTIHELREDLAGFIAILRRCPVLPVSLEEYQALVPGYFRRLRDGDARQNSTQQDTAF